MGQIWSVSGVAVVEVAFAVSGVTVVEVVFVVVMVAMAGMVVAVVNLAVYLQHFQAPLALSLPQEVHNQIPHFDTIHLHRDKFLI